MKFQLATLVAAAALTGVASAAPIVLDNYIDEQNGATTGAVANFRVQTFTPNVAGLGVNDTVTANSPLPATVFLNSVDFLRAVSGDSPGTPGDALFIDVYEGIGDGGTYLGSSTNSIVVDDATGLDLLTWTFNSIALDSTAEHAFVWSTDGVQGGVGQSARVQVARDAGGAFGSAYAGGQASNATDGAGAVAFDARFEVTLDTVPEPGSLALLGLGGLALLRRRRA